LVMQFVCDLLNRLHCGETVVWSKPGSEGLSASYFLASPSIQHAVAQAKEVLIKNGLASLLLGGVIYVGITYFFTQFFI